MKNIIVINGSYHEQGMTTALIDGFVKGISETCDDAHIQIVSLIKTHMEYCHGCWSCTKMAGDLGMCVIVDDVRDVLQKMHHADVIVFATPIYEFGPTAVMKKFMERNLPIIGPKGFLKGRNARRSDKYGVVLLSSGAPWPINVLWGVTRYPTKMLTWLLKLWSCGHIYALRAGAMESSEKMKQRFVTKSYMLGKKIGKKI